MTIAAIANQSQNSNGGRRFSIDGEPRAKCNVPRAFSNLRAGCSWKLATFKSVTDADDLANLQMAFDFGWTMIESQK
jgi:hypothetical protein